MNCRTKELYEQILKTTKEIKASIVFDLTDEISFSGKLPEHVVRELGMLSSIDGQVVGALIHRGENVEFVEGREDCVCYKTETAVYTVHKSKLPGNDILLHETSEKETLANNNLEADNFEQLPSDAEEKADSFNEIVEFQEEHVCQEDELVDEQEEATDFEEAEELGIPLKNVDNVTSEPLKATVIGGGYVSEPVIAPMSRIDIFTEEKRKASTSFVFDSYRVSVGHMGCKPEDMQFMIAPLKIQKFACPTVPIIVSIYYKNRLYTASSFDKNEDGKNIVEINVGEYGFLCRGFFDENGKFQSTVMTTEFTAKQGDVLNIASLKKHNAVGADAKNGHIKFRYTGEDGPGILEIFPLELGEKDFVMMTRCGEFVEYTTISDNVHGLNRAILYDAGIKSEVVCIWDGDYLEVEIVPV